MARRPSNTQKAARSRNGKPATKRKRDKEVLQAAAKVFYSRGYADASVQDIADELGILKGSLYHYTDSKEDLLYRILDETHAEVEAILAEIKAMTDAGPLERLHEYTRRQVEYTSKNLAKMAIYYRDADGLSKDRRRDIKARRKVHEQFVTELVVEAQERGEASKSLDPVLATNCLFGSMIWVYRWYRPRTHSAQEVAEACADFVLRGIVGELPAAK